MTGEDPPIQFRESSYVRGGDGREGGGWSAILFTAEERTPDEIFLRRNARSDIANNYRASE